jgi:hypothetical protein
MAYIYDLSDQWNASGTTFTGIKLNVTDTASASTSLLMDLQVGGVSRFSVRKDGAVIALNANLVAITSPNILQLGGSTSSTDRVGVNAGGLIIGGAQSFSFSSGLYATPDTFLVRDAANTLAQRNGVNAQAFNLYNTYTDASNYERGFMRFVSNVLQIGSEKLGTGTARALAFQTDGTTRLTIAANGALNATSTLEVGGGTIAITSNNAVMWGSGLYGWISGNAGAASVPDLALARDAADNLAQRRGTNAQTNRLYGTYTDASNYRRLTKTMSTAGVAEIKPEGAGTGASGNVLHISGLPTSNPGPGILWNNAGTPAIGT